MPSAAMRVSRKEKMMSPGETLRMDSYSIGTPDAVRHFEHDGPMQPEYLARLSAPVQQFIREVEARAHVDIEVVPDSTLNSGGPMGLGNLEVEITAQRVQLFAPTNGYFP